MRLLSCPAWYTSRPTLGASSSEESDGYLDDDDVFTPLTPPPGLALDPDPPDPSLLEPMNPHGAALVGRHIPFRRENFGWCLGIIRSRNQSPRTKVAGNIANFHIYYAADKTTGTYPLSSTSVRVYV
jgi:hypothetical protein